jgi:hypothetical protein
MFKSVFAATAALSMSAGAALAGPYVNVETNAGWTGSDYTGATTDFHVGYEGALGENGSYYVQGGASLVTPDGGTDETVPSGKAGLGFALSFIGSGDDDIDKGYGAKIGLKYDF